MNVKIKFKIDTVNLTLTEEEMLDLRTLIHDYIDNVEDGTINTCCDGLLEFADKIAKELDNID